MGLSGPAEVYITIRFAEIYSPPLRLRNVMAPARDLLVAADVWNDPAESLDSVNRRIHDGVPLHRLEERARNYVAHILDPFPYAEVKAGSSILEIGSGTGYIMSAMDQETRSRGFSTCCGVVSVGMIRLFRMLGVEFAVLGPARRHWNEDRYPVRFGL